MSLFLQRLRGSWRGDRNSISMRRPCHRRLPVSGPVSVNRQALLSEETVATEALMRILAEMS